MAKPARKVIVTCAITGAIHTPTMSAALPFTSEDIATQAIDAARAGAAILHLHARNPSNGAASIRPEDFGRFLPLIRQGTEAVVNISTGGSLNNTIEERIEPARRFSPEMCSLNMGSMNFSFHPLAERYQQWKHEWERDYIANSDSYIVRNTFRDIGQVAAALGGEHQVKFEHECYDVGHLYNLKFCMDIGWFKPPIFIQFIFGILGGIGADYDNLVFMKRTADRLFGDRYQWSVLGAGAAQLPLATQAAMMGDHVRVGLEDSLFLSRGEMAPSNAAQVEKMCRILRELGFAIATPDEARAMLALKGADRVTF
ncbi:MAG: 3-keto-5-aminohexanoate cleavage protein [Rhodocyclaceae bacterium]|nr:3-keto-5-aminohexanoate cleavage protein [Rhodocyclaceae bacterium]